MMYLDALNVLIKNSPKLKSLFLNNIRFYSKLLSSFDNLALTTISSSNSLTSLDFSGHTVDTSSIKNWVDFSPHLRVLILDKCFFYSGLDMIETLQTCSSLTHLSLLQTNPVAGPILLQEIDCDIKLFNKWKELKRQGKPDIALELLECCKSLTHLSLDALLSIPCRGEFVNSRTLLFSKLTNLQMLELVTLQQEEN